jgi:hypothetical protein
MIVHKTIFRILRFILFDLKYEYSISEVYLNLCCTFNLLRYFYVITGTVIGATARIGYAIIRTASLQLRATGITLRNMLIALWIGAVDHLWGHRSTVITGRNNGRVYSVYIYSNPVVKDIAFSFKILTISFLAVFDDAAM